MNDDTELLTVPETARLLRISRNLAYELVARGELPAVRLGRVIRIPRHELRARIRAQAGGDRERYQNECSDRMERLGGAGAGSEHDTGPRRPGDG